MKPVILFDLDGTLLPMDQDLFTKTYFGELAKWMAPYGFEAEKLIKAVWTGTAAMVKNDGTCSNEQRFWSVFNGLFEDNSVKENYDHFYEFYLNGFKNAKHATGYNPASADTVKRLKESGYRIALATNPLFPSVATYQRIEWAGLNPEDFELVTTYENSTTCKPNPEYYREVAKKLNVEPDSCIMIGNDVGEDGAAKQTGMKVFYLTDDLLNRNNLPYENEPHGSFADLNEWLGIA